MTDREILVKAMEKVKDKYNPCNPYTLNIEYNEHYAIIFTHEFCKALWGEQMGYCSFSSVHKDPEGWLPATEQNPGWYPRWIYHIEHMVKAKDPLKYIEKFL